MRSRRFLIALLFLLTTVSGLSARTTITWWQFWTDPDIKPVIESMVADFEKANPDIDVEVTDLTWANGHEKIAIAFGSSTGSDIVELGSDWIAEFASNDLLKDLSGDISSDSGQFQGWGMSTYKGKVYAQPWILGTRILFGNRTLLTRAGFDSNYVPVKWNDLLYACKKVSKLGKGYYGWGSNTAEKHRLYKKFLPFFWSNDAQIFSDDGKYCLVASDRAIYALTFYKQLHDSCGYVDTQRGIEDAFLDGKIGFIMSGDWLLKRVEKEKRDITLVATLMPGQNFPGRSFLGGEFLAVNAASKNPEAAMKFVRFITSPENQVRFCKANRSANPSSVQAQKDPYFESNIVLQTFIKQIRLSNHPPVDPDWVYIEDAIEGAVEDALFGDGLIAQPLYEAEQKIDKIKHIK